MKVMADYYYTKNHEWLRMEGEKAYIGITDYAQKSMGDIVYVEIPELEEFFDKGSCFSVIESVKTASDIYMPVDGVVTQINNTLEEEPESLNEDAYANWIIGIQLKDKEQLKELMTGEEYETFCK